eukprot:TRINITY_DN86_c0_g2_i1.p1 TRINITY_DN86_c0_g2~~TRINITY_DN86_c0_g2_i1.p1  ORF type:complete len:212 (+),score=58.12 TRINITY_DN86_c0_g2_i1:558-1193(+)
MQLGDELQSNLVKVAQYASFINKNIKLLAEKEEFVKKQLAIEEQVVKSLGSVTSNGSKFMKTLQNTADFHIKRSALIKETSKHNLKLICEFKEEQTKLEAIQKMAVGRKKVIDDYNTLLNYIQSKESENEQQNIQEAQKLKDRVLEINKALLIEFSNYDKNRLKALDKIMSCNYYVDMEKAKKMKEFVKQQESNFLLYGSGTSLLLSSKIN